MTTLPEPHVEMIAPNDLRVDPELQRRRDQAHCNRIGKAFDPALFGVLRVSRREDGKYYIEDGQHRAEGARIAGRGHVPVPCLVEVGLSRADEAKRFVGVNSTTKRPTALDLFRIRIQAGDPKAVEINEVIATAGLSVSMNGAQGTISAIAAVEAVYLGRGGPKPGEPDPDLLVDTLAVLQEAWGRDRDAYDGAMLRGIGSLIANNRDRINRDRLSERLAKKGTAGYIIGQAKTLSKALRLSQPKAVGRVVADIYNGGLRTSRIEA